VSARVLPVVEAVVWANGSAWSRKIVEQSTPDERRDLPALVVPDALWGDADFMAAVWQRLNYSDPGVVIQTIDAIRAELRARAGGAE
jgi:hypothetical protein